MFVRSVVPLGLILLLFACERQEPMPVQPPLQRTTTTRSAAQPTQERDPAGVVNEFGRRMQRVSTLSPTAANDIRDSYSELVDPVLLEQWSGSPGSAPGRQTSSPWPDRIEVTDATQPDRNHAVVTGNIVEMTGAGESGRVPVRITLQEQSGKWRITAFEKNDDASAAAGVVKSYYAAINDHDYPRAYRFWGENGAPSQTLEQFTRGFADTQSVRVETGAPSRIGAAAGSRYVDVPVTIVAKTMDGREQRFRGTYTLRRSVVDGATPAQRQWHLYRASISSRT